MADKLACLYKRPQTVFTIDEIALYWQEADSARLRSSLSYYTSKRDSLYRLRRGVYATRKEYDPLELGGRIFTPSYISLETVLLRAGVIFQYREEITVVSYLSRSVECDGNRYQFRRLKEEFLLDPAGVEVRRSSPVVSIATPERALVDLFYLDGARNLDNPDVLNWNMVLDLSRRCGNKRLIQEVEEFANKYSTAPKNTQ